MDSAYPIRGRLVQSIQLPSLASLEPEAGDRLPKHTTPDEIRHFDKQHCAVYRAYTPGQFPLPLTMSVPNAAQPASANLPPPQRPTSWTASGWNPVTGFQKMNPPSVSDSDQEGPSVSSIIVPQRGMIKEVEIEAFPPRTDSYPNSECDHCSVVSRRRSSQQQERLRHAILCNPKHHTTARSQAGEENSLSPPILHPAQQSAGLAATGPAITELSSTLAEVKKLLRDAGVMEAGLFQELVRISNQRAHNECLEETYKSLYGRAAAKHIGLAERRILRREAETIYNLTRTKEWKAQVEAQMGNVRDELSTMLAHISGAVDDLCEKVARLAV